MLGVRSTCFTFILMRFIFACRQTGSVKWITRLIDTVWTAWILTVFSIRFFTRYKTKQLLKINQKVFFWILQYMDIEGMVDHILQCSIEYQLYSRVFSIQHNNYMSHLCVYMSYSLGSKHLNSCFHRTHQCKL